MCVCVRACVRACVHECMHACVLAGMHVCMDVCTCVCVSVGVRYYTCDTLYYTGDTLYMFELVDCTMTYMTCEYVPVSIIVYECVIACMCICKSERQRFGEYICLPGCLCVCLYKYK